MLGAPRCDGEFLFAAVIVVRAFLQYVSHHSFAVFAWYRIAVGIVLLLVLR